MNSSCELARVNCAARCGRSINMNTRTPNSRTRRHILSLALRGIEEMEYFPSLDARDRAIEDISRAIRWRELVLGMVITAVAVIAVTIGFTWLIAWLIPSPGPLVCVALHALRVICAVMTALVTLRLIHRCGVKRELSKSLIAAGVPVCISCGCLLCGLDDSVRKCPECGVEIPEPILAIIRA